jgi:hypothetical protein
MTNGDVDIRTRFRLDLQPKVVEFYDIIDYAGLGDDINDFVGVILLSGPRGSIYNNTDFDNPDITPALSRKMINDLELPVDPQNGYLPYQGTYTVKYSIRDNATLNVYENTFIYGFSFTEPTMDLNVASGPFTAQLRSQDLTNYGSHIDTLTRVHTLHYPEGILPAPPADIVTGLASYTVDPAYNNLWEISVETTVDYFQASDGLEWRWYGEISEDYCAYGGCLSEIYVGLDQMFDDYLIYTNTNPTVAARLRERLIKCNTSLDLLNIAWRDDDYVAADEHLMVVAEQLQLSGIVTCAQGGTSTEIVPCGPWGGGGVTPPAYTFSSGLTEVAGNVTLGGTLTQHAIIEAGAYTHRVVATDGGNSAVVQISALDGVFMQGSNVEFRNSIDLLPGAFNFDFIDVATPANNKRYKLGVNGLVENEDYSADYDARTLVPRAYVDANNGWGSDVVISDGTLGGDGTAGDPLSNLFPFPGFDTLNADYGYVEPTHAFSEITATPTTLAGYGITDAVTAFLGLSDTPSDYTGHAGKYVKVNATPDGLEFATSAGFVPETGGTFTGQVVINTDNDYPLILRQVNAGETPGTPDGSVNRLQFQDNDGDVQGYVGMDATGDLSLRTYVSGQSILLSNDSHIAGDLSLDGTVDGVDIAAFKTDYDAHTHDFGDLDNIPTTLSGYGITDGMLNTDNSWSGEFLVKPAAIGADQLVIEDSADGFEKKFITVGSLPSAAQHFLALTDTPSSYSGAGGYVLMVNTGVSAVEFVDISSAYISTSNGTLDAMTEKGAPVDNDVLILEDSEDSYQQKKVLLRNLPAGTGDGSIVLDEDIIDATTTNIVVGNTTDHRGIVIMYTLTRGSTYQTGEITLLNDGGTMDLQRDYIGDPMGETIASDIDGANIRLNVTLTSTGTNAYLEYIVIYPDGTNAWKGPGAVQYSTTLTDDATTNIVVGDTADNRAIKVIYSMERDGLYQSGELSILNKGGTLEKERNAFGDNCGETIAVDISGTDIRINATLSATGDDADFEYIVIYPDYVTVISSNVWERSGSNIRPVNAGDDILLSSGEQLKFGGTGTAVYEGGGNTLTFDLAGSTAVVMNPAALIAYGDLLPDTGNANDVGGDGLAWKDIFYAGVLHEPTVDYATIATHTPAAGTRFINFNVSTTSGTAYIDLDNLEYDGEDSFLFISYDITATAGTVTLTVRDTADATVVTVNTTGSVTGGWILMWDDQVDAWRSVAMA